MEKQIVHYTPTDHDYIKVGDSANVYPTDHTSFLVSNSRICHTSQVLSYDEVTGVFETLNSIYKPVGA